MGNFDVSCSFCSVLNLSLKKNGVTELTVLHDFTSNQQCPCLNRKIK